jgi:V8-like Glu-specific endopeptidase
MEDNNINFNKKKNFAMPIPIPIHQTQNRFEDYLDTLEGIVDNEPQNNKYEGIKFHKLNEYPYFLIGKVISKFEFDGQNQHLKGVGILVGPDVVLTVAHNLCYMKSQGNIYKAKQVYFEPAANGKFNLFEKIKFRSYHVPDNYISALNDNDENAQLYNDWGLIFLSQPVGDSISKYFDIKNCKYLDVKNGLYSFFSKNEAITSELFNYLDDDVDETKVQQQINSKEKKTKKKVKISIVGYSKDKINNIKNHNKSGSVLTAPIASNNNNCGNENSAEEREREDKNININININTKQKTQFLTEGLFKTTANNKLRRNIQLENLGNGVDYILFNNEELNRDFNENDDENLIMTESKGTLKMDLEEIDNYFRANCGNIMSNKNNICNKGLNPSFENNNINNNYIKDKDDIINKNPATACFEESSIEAINNVLSCTESIISPCPSLENNKLQYLKNSHNEKNTINSISLNLQDLHSSQNLSRLVSNSLNSNELKSLKYPISTYKGQSGSPIFLRIKKNDNKNLNNNNINNYKNNDNNENKSKYLYIFIGLHSRRGPMVNDKITEAVEKMQLKNGINTTNLIALDTNLNPSLNTNTENAFVNINNSIDCGDKTENAISNFAYNPNVQNKNIYAKHLLNNNDNSKSRFLLSSKKSEETEINNLIQKNGICNYNIALNILGDTSKNIKDIIIKNRDDSIKEKSLNSHYVLVKLYTKEEMIPLKGLFKNQISLEILFQVASDYMKLPIEYVRFRPCADQFTKNFLTYNHDREKCLDKILDTEDNNNLELFVNINKNTYSKFVATNIYDKICENYNIDKIKADFKKYSKHVFDHIFNELKGFDPNTSFYGKFFKLVRDCLIKKLGFENMGN